MKLQEGDYVKNLTEKQWNELLGIEGMGLFPPYYKEDIETHGYFKNGLLYDGEVLCHTVKPECKQELTFRQFKSRAKNTFSHG
jgi:hypothetical protein